LKFEVEHEVNKKTLQTKKRVMVGGTKRGSEEILNVTAKRQYHRKAAAPPPTPSTPTPTAPTRSLAGILDEVKLIKKTFLIKKNFLINF
jgi:hypothetical protein